MREYSTRTKPLLDQKVLQILDQIFAEEINSIKTSYGMDYWIMNVIYYSTALTVLEKEGRLQEEKRRPKANEKPELKIGLETRIQAIRRKLSHTYVLQECLDTQQYTKRQNVIKKKMEKWYGKMNRDKLLELQSNLKHDLKIESEKLKRRNTVQERRYINRQLKTAPKKVYRSMKRNSTGPIEETPEKNEVDEFWRGLWEGTYTA